MSAKRKAGLITDENAKMIADARGRTEVELLFLLAGEIGQVAAAMLCGRSQSWASRHLAGEIGLIKNREYQREYNRRTRTLKAEKIEPEALARLLAERLVLELRPIIDEASGKIAEAIVQAGQTITQKLGTATN